jgi:hypothetical protein
MGQAGRKRVEAEFSHAHRVQEIEEIYHTLVKRAPIGLERNQT